MASRPVFSGVLFGAAYYPEYQVDLDLARDFDLMVEAGFTVVRVGESVWSTWEPEEGRFELEWLAPTLDEAHRRGIGVILGMPTYAIPPWLQRRHPELAAETVTGQPFPWGARQEMDQSAPAYRFYAERVVRRILERYADHPSVIGFQVDNEPGFRMPHNESTFQRFVDWLRASYGSVDRLNEEWGLVYWSHRLTSWADLWRPDGNTTPQYDIEWRRFQASLATELMSWQGGVVREFARDDQFVTTCISYTRAQVADDELVAPLDLTAGNPYYQMQDGLDWSKEIPREELWWSTGVWALFEWGDRAWSSADAPFLVTETNAQSVGDASNNFPPYSGQIKQAAFALLARGGRMVEYWHWNTLQFGSETYWGGVLPHSGNPGRIYREVAQLGESMAKIGGALDDFEPDSDVLMLYSTESKWAFEFDAPLRMPQGGPNTESYALIFDAFYRGLFESGAQIRVRHARTILDIPIDELIARHPIMVVPALYIADDALLERLREYAESGGHLVTGMKTGYGDELSRARRAEPPAKLTSAAGITYDESTTLVGELAVVGSEGFAARDGAAMIEWTDVVRVADAEILATFEGNELGAQAALTSRRADAGRVSYVAGVPNVAFARSLGEWLVRENERVRWQAPEHVTVQTGSGARTRFAFVSNWSSIESVVVLPVAARNVETGEDFGQHAPLTLEPRAAVLLELERDDSTALTLTSLGEES